MDITLAFAYCGVAALPLFFFYLIAKEIWGKKKRNEKLIQFLERRMHGNPILGDVEKLIIGLNSFPLCDRPLEIRRIVKMGSRGVDVLVTALDMPYCWTSSGFEITSQEFVEVWFDYFTNVHNLLVRTLAKVGNSHFEKLRDALQHPNRNVRLSTLSALGKTQNPLAVEVLVPFLKSTDVEERIGAVIALGELRAKPAVEKIIVSLHDSVAGVREMGIRALIKINDVRALPALDELARTDQTVIDDRPVYRMRDLAEDAIKRIRKKNPVG